MTCCLPFDPLRPANAANIHVRQLIRIAKFRSFRHAVVLYKICYCSSLLALYKMFFLCRNL